MRTGGAEWGAITSGAIADEVKIGPDANRTPQQRRVIERAADEPSVPEWAKAMFDAQASMLLEQANKAQNSREALRTALTSIHTTFKAALDAQADIIEQLHVANKHLAGRIDKVEGVAQLRHYELTQQVHRLLRGHPALEQPTIQQQSDESWTQPKEEGPWDWAARADAELAQAREKAAKQLKEEDNRG